MSSYTCGTCGTEIIDSPQGYTTECEHHPFTVADIGRREKRYPEPDRPETRPPSMIAGRHYEDK